MLDQISPNVLLINGQWREAADGRTYDVINPADEQPLATIAYGSAVECRQALEAAATALPAWMKRTSWDRAVVLKQVATLLRQRCDGAQGVGKWWAT